MQQTSDDQYSAWCARLKQGDRSALNDLFQAIYSDLLQYAKRYVDREQDAQDILQDAFLHLWRRRDGLDPSRSLKSLLFVSVRNRALNHVRDAARRTNRQTTMDRQPSTLPSPEQESEAELLGNRIRGWIDQLPERRREAFRLSRYHGLSYKEVARVMDISVRTVERHIQLALSTLRDRMREFEPDRLSP